jgi:hypothetical protein
MYNHFDDEWNVERILKTKKVQHKAKYMLFATVLFLRSTAQGQSKREFALLESMLFGTSIFRRFHWQGQ